MSPWIPLSVPQSELPELPGPQPIEMTDAVRSKPNAHLDRLNSPDPARTCAGHAPIVAGSWYEPTNGDGAEQIVIAAATCRYCRGQIVQVQRRSQPTDRRPSQWPIGDELLGSTIWVTAP